jgi:hypothetical protein
MQNGVVEDQSNPSISSLRLLSIIFSFSITPTNDISWHFLETHQLSFHQHRSHNPNSKNEKKEMRKTAAAKKGKSPASSSGGDSKTKTTAKSSRLPLESVHCCVETFNSDGVDSSNGFIQILKVKPLFCFHSHS